mgnify:CR=1 FL=1
MVPNSPPFDDAGVPSYNVRQAFLLDKDEVIYGLGQQQTGKVNQRNQKLFLRNQNMSICIPFIHSIKDMPFIGTITPPPLL